jgi:hypothetical protein
VSQYNWTIPFRLDLELRPLDLMRFGRPGLIDTSSFKLSIWCVRLRSDEHDLKEKGVLTWLRFPMSTPARRTGGDLRR